jgi:hypothetical protein
MQQSHRYNLIAGLLMLIVVAVLLWAMTTWAGDQVTYHLTKRLPIADDSPSEIRVVGSDGSVPLKALWREKGTPNYTGYELWERLTGFANSGEAHTLLMTWPICANNSRCAEISRGALEKALGRDLEAKPMQTSTSIVTWK